VSVRVTRRSFLAAGAGVLAGGLARGGAPLAASLAPPRPRLSELWLGAVPPSGRTIVLPAGADMLGVEWEAPAGAYVQLRLRTRAGRWSEWVSAAGCAASRHRDAAAGAPARIIGSPVWSGGASALELRSARPLAAVRLHLVDASSGLGARRLALARSLPGSAGALAAVAPAVGTGQPPILARATWARGMARPRVAPAYGAVRIAFVHHTETPNGYLPGEVPAMLRAIFAFHRDVKGWNDIGYNFVIDAFGRIFEARAGGIDEPVVGAQAGGYNLVSTGVALLGAFASRSSSPAAARSLRARCTAAFPAAPTCGCRTSRATATPTRPIVRALLCIASSGPFAAGCTSWRRCPPARPSRSLRRAAPARPLPRPSRPRRSPRRRQPRRASPGASCCSTAARSRAPRSSSRLAASPAAAKWCAS